MLIDCLTNWQDEADKARIRLRQEHSLLPDAKPLNYDQELGGDYSAITESDDEDEFASP